MQKKDALTALSALANETRLDLVRALVRAGGEGLAAGEIARRLSVSASRLSFHLSALEQAGLIVSRREARHVIYSVEAGRFAALFAYLFDDCCCADPAFRPPRGDAAPPARPPTRAPER